MKLQAVRRWSIKAIFFIMTAVLVSCATYQDRVGESRRLLTSGDSVQALEKLEKLAATEDGDQLVHLLDYGVALQIAGKINESNTVLMKADKLLEELDYHSITRVTGSFLGSESVKQYKGDTFEKIFINAYLAMNFLEQGKLDEALVEARRMNEKYLKLRSEEKKTFELNPFAKYLSAVVWEAAGQYDDAYIAYSEAYKLSPLISTIQEDLIRAAKKSRRMEDHKKWKKAFPQVEEKPEWYDKKLGEVILIYQQGWGPRKYPDPGSPRFPMLRPVISDTYKANLVVNGQKPQETDFVYDVENAAINTLMEDRGSLVARRLGGFVAKEVMADQIRQKNEALGLIAWIFFHASDQADLRQWSMLPQSIQISRVYLKPGKYQYHVQGLDRSGHPTGEVLEPREIQIKSNQRNFIVWRSLK